MSDDLNIQTPAGAAKRKDKLRVLQLIDTECMRNTMSTKEGRRTIFRIIKTTNFFGISFDGSSKTFFNEGKREIGRLLYEELNDICPEQYAQMMSENRKPKEPENV